MNILLVYAHPEPTSLNGSLKAFTVSRLEKAGHRVQVSDLYAMKWKSALDADDFPYRDKSTPFHPSLDSQKAFEQGTQSADVAKEQEKLLWADALILQFPLWWYTMPAILKGWIDRVYAYGFAYGVGEHSNKHWGDRFGDGAMKGKRAMLLVTVGGWEPHYSARGINGPMDDLLFPIHHGVLWYPGFDVLPPSVIYRTGKIDEKRMAHIQDELGQKLDNLWNIPPIAFRRQNDGDYAIPSLVLNANIMPEHSGFSIHVAPE